MDGDKVDVTNINRQLPALHSSVGQAKSQVMSERLRDINPLIELDAREGFLLPEEAEALLSPSRNDPFTHVVDAIDSLSPKIALLVACKNQSENGLKFISSMGAGGRLDPSRIKIVDLFSTYNDPFAMQLRKRLRRQGVREGLPCVWSDEPVERGSLALAESARYKKSYFGTISYLPAAVGLTLASYVIREILGETDLIQEPSPRVILDPRPVIAIGSKKAPRKIWPSTSKPKNELQVSPLTDHMQGGLSLEEALSRGHGFEGEGVEALSFHDHDHDQDQN